MMDQGNDAAGERPSRQCGAQKCSSGGAWRGLIPSVINEVNFMFNSEEINEIERLIRQVLKQDPDGSIKKRIDQEIYGGEK